MQLTKSTIWLIGLPLCAKPPWTQALHMVNVDYDYNGL